MSEVETFGLMLGIMVGMCWCLNKIGRNLADRRHARRIVTIDGQIYVWSPVAYRYFSDGDGGDGGGGSGDGGHCGGSGDGGSCGH